MWPKKDNVQATADKTTLEYQCPLCGRRFTSEESEACKACPKFMRCSLVMCPNCSHEFPGH
jgi:RNA polymerase subunit RPABC4/transcription elongation factor Spt4